jgi:autoinducer 2 (AI-2) kinase
LHLPLTESIEGDVMTKNAGYILAIDAGTGSGRAVLFDSCGSQVAVGQEEWTHKSDPRYPNSMEFDVIHNWQLLCRCIEHACHQGRISPSSIVAVSATSMREGIVLYNTEGNELWGCANVDARAANEVRLLKEQFPGLEEKFYRISGQTFALGALPRLLWVKNFMPEAYEQIAKISMLSDWVLFRLCGEIATDPSNGGTSGIYSLADRNWVPEMARTVGLRHDIFPPSVESGTIIGKVTTQAARDTGLPKGLPVVMGGGDVQFGCVGLGVVRPSQIAVLGGTFWQLVNLSEPATDPKMNIRVNPHAVPGLNQAEAISFFVGLTTRWFRDAFCQPEAAIASERAVDTYHVLEDMARAVPPGSRGIIPIFSDVMHYGNWYHAAPSLLNLRIDPSVCGKAEIFRALEENAAIVSASNLKQISAFTGADTDTLVFAGGASKGSLWCQILADVTGKQVRVPVVKEATALGGAIAAGVGIGLYPKMADAADSLVCWERDYEPNRDNYQLYQEIQDKWARAYAAQRSLVDEAVTQPMWKAPGL